jgi:hypothetical protein
MAYAEQKIYNIHLTSTNCYDEKFKVEIMRKNKFN